MDQPTLNFYDRHAVETATRYRAVDQTAWRQQLQEAFPPGSRILDVGTGSGRDLAAMLEMGFNASGTEPVAAMRQTLADADRDLPRYRVLYQAIRGAILSHQLPPGTRLPSTRE